MATWISQPTARPEKLWGSLSRDRALAAQQSGSFYPTEGHLANSVARWHLGLPDAPKAAGIVLR